MADPLGRQLIGCLWTLEADNYLHVVPKVLVGCKKDLRSNGATLDSLWKQRIIPVPPYAGDKLAVKIKALAYFETSAIGRKGVDELFNYVTKAALKQAPKRRISGLRRFLSRSDLYKAPAPLSCLSSEESPQSE